MTSGLETSLTSVPEDEKLLLEVDLVVLEKTVPRFAVDALGFEPPDPRSSDEPQGHTCRRQEMSGK